MGREEKSDTGASDLLELEAEGLELPVEAGARESSLLVVGLGASAGGLEAFKTFFQNMPADSGMAFVLVQHLDPNYESSLVSIVGGYTKMPVAVAQNGRPLRPNSVFVIPPDAILRLKDGTLQVHPPTGTAERRTSINTFLTSLAEDQGENAVAIILSGFGSDGALGVEAIKEHGGLTLSQAEVDHHAKSGMPQSAVSSGHVDHVLPVQEMPGISSRLSTASGGSQGADTARWHP